MSQASTVITADEVNCLIHAYLEDSGFTHTAFSLRNEGQLEASTKFNRHIPRGELLELLTKALLYIEVECHFKKDGLENHCKAPFALLERHMCSIEPPKPSIPVPSSEATSAAPASEEMEVDTDAEANTSAMPQKEMNKMTLTEHSVEQEKQTKSTKQSREKTSVMLLSGHKTEVFTASFNPIQTRILASGSKDSNVKLWDIPDATPKTSIITPADPIDITSFLKDDAGDLTSLHWNPTGTLLGVGSYDSILRLVDLKGSIYLEDTSHTGPIFTVRFSKSGKYLASASLDKTSCVWDVETKQRIKQFKLHNDCCLDLDWITDTVFATAGADHQIFVVGVEHDKPIYTFSGHSNEVNQVKANPDGTRLASCSDDMSSRIWSVDRHEPLTDDESIPGIENRSILLQGHTHCVSAVGWVPNTSPGEHELLATASFDSTAIIWNSVTGARLHEFRDHLRPIYCLSMNPTGEWLATGGGDGYLNVYNLKTKKKTWVWTSGNDKPGIFEITWQKSRNGKGRFALAMECRQVAVIDIERITKGSIS